MAAPVQVDTAAAVPGFVPPERDLARSEEEEKLLKQIREEKERLWCEIQVRAVRESSIRLYTSAYPLLCFALWTFP